MDNLPLERGIVTDAASRLRLIHEVDKAFRQSSEAFLKRSEGDYSPDPKANRFPPVEPTTAPTKEAPEGNTVRALFKLRDGVKITDPNLSKRSGSI